MCINCGTFEEELECDLNLDELDRYSYTQIMNLVREQEFLDKKGVILH